MLWLLGPARAVYAHCDIPCGIYDPEQARIEAELVSIALDRLHAAYRQRNPFVIFAGALKNTANVGKAWPATSKLSRM